MGEAAWVLFLWQLLRDQAVLDLQRRNVEWVETGGS